MYRCFFLTLLTILSLTALGQTYADWWYFGNKAGIHFTSGGPVADTNSAMKSIAGCASISDQFGNLLFYTKGDTIWDASHNVMQNGTGLQANGGFSVSTQSAWIVPRPNSATEFYVFTVRKLHLGGIWYSKVDMTLNGGLGGVVVGEKNIPLVGQTPEMLTCLRKPNNLDYWLVTMRLPGDTAYAYEITSAGINLTPVKSNTTLMLDTTDEIGYLRGSQQNDKIAMTIWWIDTAQTNHLKVHLFDFDNTTGEASYDFGISPSLADTQSYGVEFSPDGTKLYVQSLSQSDLRQYDLSAGSEAAVNASEAMVGDSYTTAGGGALQLGPDGIIYVARNSSPWLASVLFPNALGGSCGYNHDGVFLENRLSIFGLPQFVPLFVSGNVSLEDNCFGDTSYFFSTYPSVDSVTWNFGDPGSGALNTSHLSNPSHVYSDTGIFTITLLAYEGFLIDTQLLQIHILPRQQLDLGPDTTLCEGPTVILNIDQPYSTFLWSSGSTDSVLFIATDTVLSVTVFGVCDTLNDTVRIRFVQPLQLSVSDDTVVCDGTDLWLYATVVGEYTLAWNDGTILDSLLVTESGIYSVTAGNLCGSDSADISVSFITSPTAVLPPDTVQCFDQPITLSHPNEPGISYFWSDSTSAKNIVIDTSATVWLAAINECGQTSDTIQILFNGQPYVELGEDTIICPDDSIDLNASWPGATYIWGAPVLDSARTDTMVRINEEALYIVTITYGFCEYVESKRITHDPLVCPTINCALQYPNVMTPNADGLNDRFRAWSDCDIRSYEMFIYNRWGQLVHHSDNASFGWDGFVNGVPAPEGVYFFQIDFKDRVVVDEDRNVYQGSFTLVR